MSAKWIKTKISALANDMTDGPFGSDLKMVHYTDKREARIVQLSNVGEDGWLDENVKYTTFSHAHEIGRCIIEPGNIIVAKMMPAGRAILCPNHEPMFVQGSDVVKIVPNDRINPTFFVYMTKQNDYLKQIEKNTQGSTRARTSISKLKEITLTIPEARETQNKLAKILVTCDTVIQNTQKTIDKYKAIKQGMMQDLFIRGLTKDGKLRPSYKEAPELYKESELGMIPKEWEVKKIENICLLSSGSTPKRSNDNNFLGNICWVTSGELKQKYLSDTWEKISENAMRRTNLKLYSSGTVIIAIYGQEAEGTRGCCSILNTESTISQACLAFDNFNHFDNEFFYYWYYLNGKTVAFKYAQGTKQQNLSSDSVAQLDIITPSVSEQNAIANRLSSIDSAIQKEEALFAKYKKIKNGLMSDLLVPPEDAEIIDETGE